MMNRFLDCILTAGLLTLATGMAMAGTDAVYQRVQSDGAVSLTNVPDGDGYQVLLTGSHATASPAGTSGTGNGAVPAVGAQSQPEEVALTQPALQPEPVALRTADTPPSIEARKGKQLDPEGASSLAYALAGQAQDQITSAGGAHARLRNLYQESMSAFQAPRSAADRR